MLNKEKPLHIGIPLKLDQVKAAVRVASKNLQIVDSSVFLSEGEQQWT